MDAISFKAPDDWNLLHFVCCSANVDELIRDYIISFVSKHYIEALLQRPNSQSGDLLDFPIHMVARFGHFHVVDRLIEISYESALQCGRDGENLLHIISNMPQNTYPGVDEYGETLCTRFPSLLRKTATDGWTPLHYALLRGNGGLTSPSYHLIKSISEQDPQTLQIVCHGGAGYFGELDDLLPLQLLITRL